MKNIFFDFLVFLLFIKHQSFFKKHTSIKLDKGICTLLRHSDVNMFIVNLTSLFYFSNLYLPVYIVDDGSLTENDYKKLKSYFRCTIVSTIKSGKRMLEILKHLKHYKRFRFDDDGNIFRYKQDPILSNPFSKFIYLDADVLFFKKPIELIKWLSNDADYNLYTAHMPYSLKMFGERSDWIVHSYRVLLFNKYYLNINPSFNDGLLAINKKDIVLKRVNQLVPRFYENLHIYHFTAQEACNAFLVTPEKYLSLSTERYTNGWDEKQIVVAKKLKPVSIHYAGPNKRFFRPDAVRLILDTNLFKANSLPH